jgi:hypothetical protein
VFNGLSRKLLIRCKFSEYVRYTFWGLRIWGSGVRISSGAPAPSIIYYIRRRPKRFLSSNFVRKPLISSRSGDLKAPVAQLDRAPDFESGGQGFESLPARQITMVQPRITGDRTYPRRGLKLRAERVSRRCWVVCVRSKHPCSQPACAGQDGRRRLKMKSLLACTGDRPEASDAIVARLCGAKTWKFLQPATGGSWASCWPLFYRPHWSLLRGARHPRTTRWRPMNSSPRPSKERCSRSNIPIRTAYLF